MGTELMIQTSLTLSFKGKKCGKMSANLCIYILTTALKRSRHDFHLEYASFSFEQNMKAEL
jgi:hypothetical protein